MLVCDHVDCTANDNSSGVRVAVGVDAVCAAGMASDAVGAGLDGVHSDFLGFRNVDGSCGFDGARILVVLVVCSSS